MSWFRENNEPVRMMAALKPKPDITVQELATIVAKLTTHGGQPVEFLQQSWDDLPPEIKRHFLFVEGPVK